MKRIATTLAAICLATLMLTGCGPKAAKPYAHPDLRGGAEVSVALLPFDNLTEDQGAAKTIESLTLVEFLKRAEARVRVVDPGEVNSVLLDLRIRVATSIPRETILALGERLGVDYLIGGVVHEYTMQRSTGGGGEVPVVSLSLRIVDALDGEIVWALSSSRRGNDKESIFGIGRVDSLEQLAQQTVESMAEAFAKSRGKK